MSLFQIEAVNYRYPAKDSWALREVSLEIPKGEFVVVTGGPGDGKSTLFRLLSGVLPETYGGEAAGSAKFMGADLWSPLQEIQRSQIGFLAENPESYRLFRRVRRELAFGLRGDERARIGEIAASFELNHLLDSDSSTLSTGELTRVMLAAAATSNPMVLILDQPFAAISEEIRSDLLEKLSELNRGAGVTVIVTGLTSEEIRKFAHRVIEISAGRITFNEKAEGFSRLGDTQAHHSISPRATIRSNEIAIQTCDLRFSYPRAEFELRVPDCSIRAGAVTAVVGPNGVGKTTFLRLLASILKSTGGSVVTETQPLFLPADPTNTLVCESVQEELELGLSSELYHRGEALLLKTIDVLSLRPLLMSHPRDLSFFQRYSVALAALTVLKPAVLLLDEPSRGAGESGEKALLELFNILTAEYGTAVVLASNDRAFVKQCATELIGFQ